MGWKTQRAGADGLSQVRESVCALKNGELVPLLLITVSDSCLTHSAVGEDSGHGLPEQVLQRQYEGSGARVGGWPE